MMTKKSNSLNKLFLTKLQEQIKQAPGYEPIDIISADLLAKIMHNPELNYRFIKR